MQDHDKNFEKLAPMRKALHFLMSLVLIELPQDAHILCIGAGTGPELIDLAVYFPNWHFTVIEPEQGMLTTCQTKAEEAGISPRCLFCHSDLHSFKTDSRYHAATSLLVSHFIEQDKRPAFFKEIFQLLKPSGILVTADLAYTQGDGEFADLLNIWANMLNYSGMPEKQVKNMLSNFATKIPVSPGERMQELFQIAGFDRAVLFYQALFIHAWYCRKT